MNLAKKKLVMKRHIWIDIDNPPHVQFFKPIINRLVELGHQVTVTARDYAYVCELLGLAKIPHIRVGRHYGKRKIHKLVGLGIRSFQLASFARDKNFNVGVSHGARSLPPACWILRIPCITIYDYEYVSSAIFNHLSTKILIPEAISDDICQTMKMPKQKLCKYPGIKEELYLSDFKPDPNVLKDLDIPEEKVVVTLRPPATMAHYHNPKTETLFYELLNFLLRRKDAELVLLPRTHLQKEEILKVVGRNTTIKIPSKVIDGPSLIWYSDLVIGAGGTMNREAAVLGVPVYSIFQGKRGAVDAKLEKENKLKFIHSKDDFIKIEFKKRTRLNSLPLSSNNLVDFFVNEILSLAITRKYRRKV